jgi:deoxyribonuclease V
MIACFDVQYVANAANAAGIVFRQWGDTATVYQFTVQVTDVGEYRPGKFYERELKPLRALLPLIACSVQCFVIDAYCHLSDDGSPGLGAYLRELLPDDSVVIGVAKNRFRDTRHAVELYRGGSDRPLFITSIGIDYQSAAAHVKSMAGEHRIPTLLKTVDRLARDGERTMP